MRALASVLLLGVVLAPRSASALPLYALQSGHTCGNCHVSPTYQDPRGWEDPRLEARKCNLSCVSCHVNPTGGGLRNTAGRYYGRSSLAMVPFEERSYSDHGRELLSLKLIQSLGIGPGAQAGASVPRDYEQVKAGVGAGATGPWSSFGEPALGPSEYALWDGRYAGLSADPLLAIGGDLRVAFYSGSATVFPMQLDLDAALHPIEHVTLFGTVAGRGRASGFDAVGSGDELPFFMREAFVMVHELPYMLYAKAGVFLPPFGTYLDDHTSFIRSDFEQSLSTSDSTVIGAEVGLAPNYPYASVAFFRNARQSWAADPEADPGFGVAFDAGWRDLGWTLGAHGMVKNRGLDAGGYLQAAGVSWGLAPWDDLPLAFIGELSAGRRPQVEDGTPIAFLAVYQEAAWTPWNGVSLRLKYDLRAQDITAAAELQQRLSAGLDLALLPGVTVFTQGRLLFTPHGPAQEPDLLVQLHLWF